jgi:hypothetical protein
VKCCNTSNCNMHVDEKARTIGRNSANKYFAIRLAANSKLGGGELELRSFRHTH